MLLLIAISVLSSIAIKAFGGSFEVGFAQIMIFVVISRITSDISVSYYKRKCKGIVLADNASNNQISNEEDGLFIFEIADILNLLAVAAGALYGFFAIVLLLSVMLFAENNPAYIIVLALAVIVIEIIFFIGCYVSANKNKRKATFFMLYLESYIVNKLSILGIMLALILFWASFAFILVCLFIIGSFGKFSG